MVLGASIEHCQGMRLSENSEDSLQHVFLQITSQNSIPNFQFTFKQQNSGRSQALSHAQFRLRYLVVNYHGSISEVTFLFHN
jgi:hypothetical protein